MLVLSRQRGESVVIGDAIDVTIVDLRGDKVRLGINAPRDIAVHRKEVYQAIQQQQARPEEAGPACARPEPPPQPAPAMPRALHNSPLFAPWKDPTSGIESFILTRRLAPIQQSFCFLSPSLSRDGRYLWFYCAFPPAGDQQYGRTLGVVDLASQEVRHFPETQFAAASPWIDPETAEAYWCAGPEIYRRGPKAEDKVVLVNRFPEAITLHRRPASIATHLTRSANGKELSIDTCVGQEWHVGSAPLDGSPVHIWQSFDRNHCHAQFSPTDPDLMLLVQEGWVDYRTGGKIPASEKRLWLLRRGKKAEPLLSVKPSHTQGHEFWAADGQGVWFVDYAAGTGRVSLATGKAEIIWPGGTCHSHADASGQYLVGDIGPFTWDAGCRVAFYNTRTRKEVNIVSALPPPPYARKAYHLDPHPQFCLDGRYIVYTTTVLGRVDVALVPVEGLRAATE